MRIIKRKAIDGFARKYPDARSALWGWYRAALNAAWESLADVRRDFPSADGVTVKSGRTATVFNVRGNRYRLITAIHYDAQKVFTMRFYAHADYDKNAWKETV